jgi:hypothetical protein
MLIFYAATHRCVFIIISYFSAIVNSISQIKRAISAKIGAFWLIFYPQIDGV